MKNFKYTITDELGIHARPAGLLVKEAAKVSSKITIQGSGMFITAAFFDKKRTKNWPKTYYTNPLQPAIILAD